MSKTYFIEPNLQAIIDECHFRCNPEEHYVEPERFAALVIEYRSAIASPDAWFEYCSKR